MSLEFGRYRVIAEVGRGATGVVYLAHDPELGRPVAIKAILDGLSDVPDTVARLRIEAEIMARVEHQHCVRVFDLGEQSGHLYLVMEYVDGASLREVLRGGRLTAEQALVVLSGALRGLAHVHRLGVVHRDVKPENILVERSGNSKLADFGLTAPQGIGDFPGAIGSPAYMSPEQVRGNETDARSDVYSCGAVLFELLTGSAPFASPDSVAVMRRHLLEDPPDPRVLRGELSAALAGLVRSAMAKDPSQRPQGAAEFSAELERVAAEELGPNWRQRGALAGLVAAAVAAGSASAGTMATAVASGAVGASTIAAAAVAEGLPAPAAPPLSAPTHPAPAAPAPALSAVAGVKQGRRLLPRSRRGRLAAAGLVLTLIAIGLIPAVLAMRPRPAPVAHVDPCLVGTWTATRSFFVFSDRDFNLTSHLSGGIGTVYSVAADGSSQEDFSRSTAYVGSESGHQYTVFERGRQAARVVTAGDEVTVSPGSKLEGLQFVADRDGVEIGQGVPEQTRLSTGTGTTLKRICSPTQLSFVDGPYVSTYRRVSSTPAPVATPTPCASPEGNADFSFCPGRAPRGALITVSSKNGCLGPGISPGQMFKKPTAEVTIYGPGGMLARGDFPLDKNAQWSGSLLIDPAAKLPPGAYQIGGGCYDAGSNVQNGFGRAYGPLPFTLAEAVP